MKRYFPILNTCSLNLIKAKPLPAHDDQPHPNHQYLTQARNKVSKFEGGVSLGKGHENGDSDDQPKRTHKTEKLRVGTVLGGGGAFAEQGKAGDKLKRGQNARDCHQDAKPVEVRMGERKENKAVDHGGDVKRSRGGEALNAVRCKPAKDHKP